MTRTDEETAVAAGAPRLVGEPALAGALRTPRGLLVQAGALIVCLALFALALAQVHGLEAGVRQDSFTLPGGVGDVPVPVLRYTPTGVQRNVVAVMAHGIFADKEMLSVFGVELARAGIVTYTFDYPGHGESPVSYLTHQGRFGESFDGEDVYHALYEVVDYAQTHAPAGATLVLVGYSMSAYLVQDYVTAVQPANLGAIVLVGGEFETDTPDPTLRNTLVINGQDDAPGLNADVRAQVAAGCHLEVPLASAQYACGDAGSGTALGYALLPGLNHLTVVTAGATAQATFDWLRRTVDPQLPGSGDLAEARLHWMLLGFAAAVLAGFPLLGLGGAALRLERTRHRAEGAEEAGEGVGARPAVLSGRVAALGMALLVPALGVGVLLTLRVFADFANDPAWAGWGVPAHVLIIGLVAALFCLAGLVWLAGLVAVPALRRGAAWSAARSVLPQAALALAVIVLLYVTLGQLSTLAWEALRLPPQRLWRAAVLAALVLPYFVALQAVVNGYAARGRWRGLLLELGFVAVLIVVLVVAITGWSNELGLLPVVLPVLPIVMLAFVAFGAWARLVLARPALLIALTQALLAGWVLGAISPLVG